MGKEKGRVRKRGWADISIDILESALTPTTKTRLMYRANLNYVRFSAYFNDFLKKDLLEEAKQGRKTLYVVSEQGKVLLAALGNAEKLFSKA